MDYTLIITHATGEIAIRSCSTLTDVTNWLVAITRAQLTGPSPRPIVSFQVINNTVL